MRSPFFSFSLFILTISVAFVLVIFVIDTSDVQELVVCSGDVSDASIEVFVSPISNKPPVFARENMRPNSCVQKVVNVSGGLQYKIIYQSVEKYHGYFTDASSFERTRINFEDEKTTSINTDFTDVDIRRFLYLLVLWVRGEVEYSP